MSSDPPPRQRPDQRPPESADTANNDPQSLLDAAVAHVVQAIGGRAGLVRLWESNPDQELLSSSYGLSEEAVTRLRPIVQGLVPRLDQELSGSVLTALDRAALDWADQHEPVQAVALPLRSKGRLIGLLCLFQPVADPKTRANPNLPRLEPAGLVPIEQIDVVIQNARLLERLLEEKRWLESVVRHSADGILILDARGRIIGINPAFERIVGWRVEEIRGRTCQDILDPRTRTGALLCPDLCPLLAGRVGPEGSATIELTYRRKSGGRVDVEANYAIIRHERGQVLGAIVGVRDITARREAEELQNTFLSVISHELQTPITIIQGYAEFLADPEVTLPVAEWRQKLTIIQEEGQRLQKMVDNLLTASRLQIGAIELRPEPLDLMRLVDRVAQRLRVAHRDRTLEVNVPDDLPVVTADEERIEQVLLNLIENAFKYSPPEGSVTVSGRMTGTEVILTVTDRGAGVPPAERERIFERFQRLDSRLVRQLKGAGLGLFVAKAIVEAHGGRIWVEEAPTGGAAFSFSLPRQQAAALPVRFRP